MTSLAFFFGIGPFEVLIVGLIALVCPAVVVVLVLLAVASKKSGQNLINCPECGGSVSRLAETCPHCGRSMG